LGGHPRNRALPAAFRPLAPAKASSVEDMLEMPRFDITSDDSVVRRAEQVLSRTRQLDVLVIRLFDRLRTFRLSGISSTRTAPRLVLFRFQSENAQASGTQKLPNPYE